MGICVHIYISLYVYDLLSVIYNRETIIYYIYYLYCIFSIFYYQNNLLHHGFTYYVVNYLVVATIHLLSKTSCIFQMNVFFPEAYQPSHLGAVGKVWLRKFIEVGPAAVDFEHHEWVKHLILGPQVMISCRSRHKHWVML